MPDPGWAGERKPAPVGIVELAMVGYEVHPDAPAPPSTKKLIKMMTIAGHMNQYDIMFSFGNAMSLAPIISGIRKFPNAPVKSGMITKKIITEACMVNNMLYTSGGILFPDAPDQSHFPITGISALGQPNWVRTPRANPPPNSSMMRPVNRN